LENQNSNWLLTWKTSASPRFSLSQRFVRPEAIADPVFTLFGRIDNAVAC
jgi:hypothetical protein